MRVFILGPYRSADGTKKDVERLIRLEGHLKGLGYDAFLAIHRDKIDDTDLTKLKPRLKTITLARLADLNLFVFTKSGIRNGLVGELAEFQARFPELARKHIVLLEKGLVLSSILDESQEGIMSIGPLRQIIYDNDDELLVVAEQVAFNYALSRASGSKP